MTTDTECVGGDAFPALFGASDAAAATAQRRYLRLVKTDVLLLVLCALAAIPQQTGGVGALVHMAQAALLLAALVITLVIRIRRF